MGVRLAAEVIYLEGPCRVEDAEPLLQLLQENAGRRVDLTEVRHLHAAVVQVLLAFRPPISGPAGEPFVRRHVEPALTLRYETASST